jgi:hypothetical protein
MEALNFTPVSQGSACGSAACTGGDGDVAWLVWRVEDLKFKGWSGPPPTWSPHFGISLLGREVAEKRQRLLNVRFPLRTLGLSACFRPVEDIPGGLAERSTRD